MIKITNSHNMKANINNDKLFIEFDALVTNIFSVNEPAIVKINNLKYYDFKRIDNKIRVIFEFDESDEEEAIIISEKTPKHKRFTGKQLKAIMSEFNLE